MIRSPQHQFLSATFPPSLQSARRARDFVVASLRDAGVDEPALADQLSLVTSELVTNAVVHAHGPVEVRVTIDRHDVRLDVIDESPIAPHQAPVSLTESSGRGLVLVDALVEEWGVTDVDGGVGKRVWARVSRG